MKLVFRRSRRPRWRIKTITDSLKTMDIFELISRSFCSKFVKNHLKSRNVRYANVSVSLQKQPSVGFDAGSGWGHLRFSQDNTAVKINAYLGSDRNFDQKIFDVTSGCLNFTARDFLIHFMDVLYNPAISVVYDGDENSIDEESVQSLLADIPIVGFTYNNFKAPNKMLQHALNNTNCFEIHGQTSSHFSAHPVLSKNFDKLVVDSPTIDLNSLLNMISPNIVLRPTIITEKDINMFLKLWMIGCANINLKLLSIYYHRDQMLDDNDIRKGIKYLEQHPCVPLRIFEYKDPECKIQRLHALKRCRNITRNDGVQATFSCNDFHFLFVVWD